MTNPTEYRLDPAHAKIRLALTDMLGASRATLVAIHNAGGYVVFDPRHQQPVQTAIQALVDATADAIEVMDTGKRGQS